MLFHSFLCPHCFQKAAFECMGEKKLRSDGYYSEYLTSWACSLCNGGLCAVVSTPAYESLGKKSGSVDDNFIVKKTYPEPKTPQAPEHTPDNIAKIYIQGKNALVRKEFDTAVMAMRKVLEMTVKTFATNPKAYTLKQKIENLKDNDLIPKSMVSWAHEIREIGNDGAHDIVTEKDAHDISFFTEMFLTYIYTLPTKIANRPKS